MDGSEEKVTVYCVYIYPFVKRSSGYFYISLGIAKASL